VRTTGRNAKLFYTNQEEDIFNAKLQMSNPSEDNLTRTTMLLKQNMKLAFTAKTRAINYSLSISEEVAIDNVLEKFELASVYRRLLPVCY
jgi:hypothetical protein